LLIPAVIASFTKEHVHEKLIELGLLEELEEFRAGRPLLASRMGELDQAKVQQAREIRIQSCLQLPLEIEHVIFVNDMATLERANQAILNIVDSAGQEVVTRGGEHVRLIPMVGLDVEWKFETPEAEEEVPQGAALLQIATYSHVLLFDLFTASSNAELQAAMDRVLTELFTNPLIVKVGFAFDKADIQMLARHSEMKFHQKVSSHVDMNEVTRTVMDRPCKSLSDGCARFLNKPLCKTQQVRVVLVYGIQA
jgi:hypothetical protein